MTDSQMSTQPWGTGGPRRLSVRDTALQAYGSLSIYRDELLRVAILPVLMSLALNLLLDWVFGLSPSSDPLSRSKSNPWIFGVMLLGWLPLTLFAVNWLRVLLLGRDIVEGFGLHWGMRETKFLLRMLLIIVMTTLLAFAVIMPLILIVATVGIALGVGGSGPSNPGQIVGGIGTGIGIVVALAVQLYFAICLSLALPATALDQSRVIRLSWAISRGVTFRLAVAFLLVTVPLYAGVFVLQLLIGWTGVYEIAPLSATLVTVLANFASMAGGFAVLAMAYRRLAGPAPVAMS